MLNLMLVELRVYVVLWRVANVWVSSGTGA